MKTRRFFYALALLPLLAGSGFAAPPKEQPTVADVAYGPDPRQKLDVYVPQEGTGPFPIMVWIHGGGWFGGDKKANVIRPTPWLKAGCAVVSIEYRLVSDAVTQKISPPIVAVLGDNRRALQYVRLHASDWKLDPQKIVVAGSSAGACSALYLGCEGERADPHSRDPVERVSTKVLGVGAEAAQTSVDPQRIREWVPGVVWGYWAFAPDGNDHGNKPDFERVLADRDKWMSYILKYSPDALISKGAPPIYFSYGQGLPPPGSNPASEKLVHSPLWAIGFQKLAQKYGVACYLQYPGHPVEQYHDMTAFLLHQLGLNPK